MPKSMLKESKVWQKRASVFIHNSQDKTLRLIFHGSRSRTLVVATGEGPHTHAKTNEIVGVVGDTGAGDAKVDVEGE